jgi:hypothetical protein
MDASATDVELKVYKAEFPGHYLGGEAVVVAKDEIAARKAVKEEMRQHGLTPNINDVQLTEVDATKPGFLHFWDGDY